MTTFRPTMYYIRVSHPEIGSSSSYADTDLGALFHWALDWAGVEFEITAEGEFDA